jgi:hypothetical protein
MDESQEQTNTCGNCAFSEKAIPQTSMNDVYDREEIKCNKKDHYYFTTDPACEDWELKQ